MTGGGGREKRLQAKDLSSGSVSDEAVRVCQQVVAATVRRVSSVWLPPYVLAIIGHRTNRQPIWSVDTIFILSRL